MSPPNVKTSLQITRFRKDSLLYDAAFEPFMLPAGGQLARRRRWCLEAERPAPARLAAPRTCSVRRLAKGVSAARPSYAARRMIICHGTRERPSNYAPG